MDTPQTHPHITNQKPACQAHNTFQPKLTSAEYIVEKKSLRKRIRAQRTQLTPSQQQRAARNLLKYCSALPTVMRAKHIALYIANDGEISPHYLAQWAKKCGKHVYYPTISARNTLIFREYIKRGHLRKNRFSIPEPLPKCKAIPLLALDVVFLPLVAFDRTGNRLGMGGGFYDRSFAFKHHNPHIGPVMIGLAHSLQEVSALGTDSWDIPVTIIATDSGVLRT